MTPPGTYRHRAISELAAIRERLPGPTGDDDRRPPGYRSAFGKWDDRASVRTKPIRRVEEERADGPQLYFPPELVPAATHPLLVGTVGPSGVNEFLTQQLYSYLSFTVDLEMSAVVPVTSDISLGRSGLHLPARMRRDAFNISTDEAWHAQFSHDLIVQVESETSVRALSNPEPAFLRRLAEIEQDLDDDTRAMSALLFAVVSETLISALLSDLPKDRRLPPAVREAVADHAEDEGRHHAYFKSLLYYFWAPLDARQRRKAGILVPRLIAAFLEPDYAHLARGLFDCRLTAEQVAQILEESYPDTGVERSIRQGSRATVKYFNEIGAIDDHAVRDAFERASIS
ncbi:diiron oxygenase [Streptomyces sp. ISL-100]|uniref:diiron oxygenase n=1 Tax=Streptomyces sp. ISL-100 TaxID=2819173 RepID=UPI001BEA82C1|nr:diiron oxygenase [Streptomyces sp. ISL-100]MBT2395734.1 diiron oxygenase [Streptomyces sp. ISL-100]